MIFDYVDIGTSDFETSISVKSSEDKVLLVEPLFHYLKNLPDGENIFKANFSISDRKEYGKIYYVPEESIQKYCLPQWVRGCNSLNRKHETVASLLKELNLPESIIEASETLSIRFSDLIELYDIEKIRVLKIDTEGHDHVILESVYDTIRQTKLEINVIEYEYISKFGNTSRLDCMRSNLRELGYRLVRKDGDNQVLVKCY